MTPSDRSTGSPAEPLGQPIVQIDAFTSAPFGGNPAGVCLLPGDRDPNWMQLVAREMNLAETAFLRPRGDGSYDLRWFTPAVEVELCGHATLASAHLLYQDGHIAKDAVARFHTLSGLLTARLQENDAIELDFPAAAPDLFTPPNSLAEALGAAPVAVSKNRMDWLVELESDATVRQLQPNLERIAALPARGVIVTARSDDPAYDFVSRFFGPAVGVPEDPVTGSAHCGLAPYWGARLGRSTMVGYQASVRGGVVGVELAGDRVRLRGHAVTVLRGNLLT